MFFVFFLQLGFYPKSIRFEEYEIVYRKLCTVVVVVVFIASEERTQRVES